MSTLSEAVRFIEKGAGGPCELSRGVERAIEGLVKMIWETGLCPVCDMHPQTSGHGKDCIL